MYFNTLAPIFENRPSINPLFTSRDLDNNTSEKEKDNNKNDTEDEEERSGKEDDDDNESNDEKGDTSKAVGVASIPTQKNQQIGTNASVSTIGAAGHDSDDDDQVSQTKRRPLTVFVNRKRKQQQNDNLSELTLLKSEQFQLEY